MHRLQTSWEYKREIKSISIIVLIYYILSFIGREIKPINQPMGKGSEFFGQNYTIPANLDLG